MQIAAVATSFFWYTPLLLQAGYWLRAQNSAENVKHESDLESKTQERQRFY